MNQKLSLQGIVAATTFLWGGAVLFVSVCHHFVPSYGAEFLKWLSSLYPGYTADGSWRSVTIASSYAIVDGAITGFLFVVIYNFFCQLGNPPGGDKPQEPQTTQQP